MAILELTPEQILPERKEYDVQSVTDPTFQDVSRSMFSTGLLNEGVEALSRWGTEYDPDDDYDVFDDLAGYEAYADKFIGVESRQNALDIKRRIDDDLSARETIAAGSGLEVLSAGVANMVVDPLTFIPIGGAAASSYRTGGRILEGAARTASIGLAASTAEEAALQHLQEVRPIEESFMNVGATTFLSGILGGAASAFGSRAEIDALAKRMDDDLRVPVPEGREAGDSTVGAAMAPTTTLEQESLQSALGLEKALQFNDPVLRTLNSPSKVTRQMSEKLAETYLYKNKNADFIASQVSVENMIKSYNLPKYTFFKEYDQFFLQYRGSKIKDGFAGRTAVKVQDVFGKARKDGRLTYQEFGEEVIKAARRGDKHEVPEVASAAASLRRNVFDPIFKRGQEAGIFGDDVPQVSTAPSYVTRLWDRNKILSDLPRFKEINAQWLRTKRDRALVELERAKAAPAAEAGSEAAADQAKNMAIIKSRASLDDAEINNIVDELINRLLSTPAGRLPYETKIREGKASGPQGPNRGQLRGAARARVYDIPDEDVIDFLVNDVDSVVESYTRSLAADTEITKQFGSVDMTDTLKLMEEDYARLSHGADAKTQRSLKQAYDRDVRDMKGMWERLRGIYALPDDYSKFLPSAERTVMNWNYMRLLGGMVVSAFTDIARPVMSHGLGRVYQDGIRGMITNFKGFRKAAEGVKEAGTALDMVLDTRARALAGMDDYMPFTNRVEGAVGALANNFGVVSLMSPWNAGAKQFVGVITQSRFIKAATKLAAGGKLPQEEITNLAANGIDQKMAKRIAAQYKKFGIEEGGVIIPNAQAWDDVEVQTIFRAAIRREVDGIIQTPGQDKPLWMSRPGWRLLGQFKSFAFSSVQRAMLSGLQRRDAAALNGAAMSFFLGMAVYATKESAAGRPLSDDWRVWANEGVDRSGLTGWAFDVNNIVEKVSRGRIGVNALVGGPPMSRYASRSALEAMFGPTYGLLGEVVTTAGSAFAGEWRAADTGAVRRLMPYQNLIYLRRIFDEAESGVNSALGIEQRRPQ